MAERHAGGVGGTLREARERRSMSLRQIANATKIPIHALEALERNDISQLPGGIFSRAFVRSYAVQVGLDPEETIQEFLAQFPHDSVLAGHPAASPIEDNLSIESSRRAATAFLKMMLFSLPIAGALLYFETAWRKSAPVVPRPAPGSTLKTRPDAPARQAVSPPLPSAAQTIAPAAQTIPSGLQSIPVPTSTTPSPVAALSTAPDHLTISLAATGPSWISAVVDGQPAIERRFEAGEREELVVRRELVLTTGNPSALVVTINGIETKPLGKAGETITRHFTRDNFKEYLKTP